MPRRRGKSSAGKSRTADQGRGFFETSSPFETYNPNNEKAKTFGGLVDKDLEVPKNFRDRLPDMPLRPEQFDNPRGYPGLALVQRGGEKPKLPIGGHQHAIEHKLEGEAKLARTGK